MKFGLVHSIIIWITARIIDFIEFSFGSYFLIQTITCDLMILLVIMFPPTPAVTFKRSYRRIFILLVILPIIVENVVLIPVYFLTSFEDWYFISLACLILFLVLSFGFILQFLIKLISLVRLSLNILNSRKKE